MALAPPLLLRVELHIPMTGAARLWYEPRDLSALTPAQRQQTITACFGLLDRLAGELGCVLRLETTPTVSTEQARNIVG